MPTKVALNPGSTLNPGKPISLNEIWLLVDLAAYAKGPFLAAYIKQSKHLKSTFYDDPNYKVAQDPWPLKFSLLWKENSGPDEYIRVP